MNANKAARLQARQEQDPQAGSASGQILIRSVDRSTGLSCKFVCEVASDSEDDDYDGFGTEDLSEHLRAFQGLVATVNAEPDTNAGFTRAASAADVEAPVAEAPHVEAGPVVDLASPVVEVGQDASGEACSARGVEFVPPPETETAPVETTFVPEPETETAPVKTTFVPEPSPDSSGLSHFCYMCGNLTLAWIRSFVCR